MSYGWAPGIFAVVLAVSGCARNAKEILALPHAEPQAWVPIQLPSASVHRVVAAAGQEMGLDVESESDSTVLLYRGKRLDTGGIYYRVDIAPLEDRRDACGVSVLAIPANAIVGDNEEAVAKPGELAFRIAVLALAKPVSP